MKPERPRRMDAQERLRQLIQEEEGRLRARVPRHRQAAILALLRALDRSQPPDVVNATLGVIAGRIDSRYGGNKALQLCVETEAESAANDLESCDALDVWASRFLKDCSDLAIAGRVLAQCETGFMRLVSDGDRSFDTWIASGRAPASWRERMDFEWWAAWQVDRHRQELAQLRSQVNGTLDGDAKAELYRTIACVYLQTLEHQAGYPDEALIGGFPVQTYRDVLGLLIAWALRTQDESAAPLVIDETALITSIASLLQLDEARAAQAVAGFTLDRHNSAYHAAVPGIAPAPLVRMAPDRLALSHHGLTTGPLLFLNRELRRRDAQAYHNGAWQREDVLRRDLYGLFSDKRFVRSSARIQLRRVQGGLRTDVDAAIFDRKTGVLALFELKSQDPFARSAAELFRQRDNVLHANHQVAGILDWLNRNGANELLNRVDHQTARRFRVRKVLPFVLGRYLAHFPDGPAPDARVAWATWPQLLRLTGGRPFSGEVANPLSALFTRLKSESPLAMPSGVMTNQELELGGARLTVFPNYAAFRNARSA